METLKCMAFFGFVVFFSTTSVKGSDYEKIQSKIQNEEISRYDRPTVMVTWEIFETKISGDKFNFSIHEPSGAEFMRGEIDLITGKIELTYTFTKISKNDYKIQEITVRDDGSRSLRLSFKFGVLPKGSALRLHSK